MLTDDGYAQAFIPERLYREILRRQAGGKGMTWDEACVETAEDADHGSELFGKRVKESARRLHNRELMQQLNKGRETIGNRARESALSVWAKIRYPCSVCGKDMVWDLTDEKEKGQIMGVLKEGGIGNWYHETCKTPTG